MRYLLEDCNGNRSELTHEQAMRIKSSRKLSAMVHPPSKLTKTTTLFVVRGEKQPMAKPLRYGGQTEAHRLANLQHLNRDGVLALAHGQRCRRVA